MVQNLGLRPEEVLFIDDARGNIEKAKDRGLQVLRYMDRKAVEAELKLILGER